MKFCSSFPFVIACYTLLFLRLSVIYCNTSKKIRMFTKISQARDSMRQRKRDLSGNTFSLFACCWTHSQMKSRSRPYYNHTHANSCQPTNLKNANILLVFRLFACVPCVTHTHNNYFVLISLQQTRYDYMIYQSNERI